MKALIKQYFVMFLIFTLAIFPACGGGGGDGSIDTTVPEDFNDLLNTLNNHASVLTTDTSNLATALQAFIEATENTSASDYKSIMDKLVAEYDDWQISVDFFDDLLLAYSEQLSINFAKTSLESLGNQATLFSVDPTNADAVAGLISSAKDAAEACAKEFDIDVVPDLYAQCMNTARKIALQSTLNTGLGAIVSTGAGIIVGGALAAKSVPVLVVVGAGIATGVVVGAIWSWCTSSSSNAINPAQLATNQITTGDFCALHTVQTNTIGLDDGSVGVVFPVPPGSGTLTVHLPNGATLILEVTVGENGMTIDTRNCNANASNATPADIDSCITGTTTTSGVDASVSDCSNITTIGLNTSPSDPAPGETVTVIATVFPTIANCTVNYEVSGTDGYTASGSPTTDSTGSVSWTIPGGAEDVVDTVKASAGIAHSEVVYTF